jgi:hypothetical protein
MQSSQGTALHHRSAGWFVSGSCAIDFFDRLFALGHRLAAQQLDGADPASQMLSSARYCRLAGRLISRPLAAIPIIDACHLASQQPENSIGLRKDVSLLSDND